MPCSTYGRGRPNKVKQRVKRERALASARQKRYRAKRRKR